MTWTYGPLVLGCGTFGGIGGSPDLIGRGLDEPAAQATMDEAAALGITLFDTAERYAAGASETAIGRWLAEGPREIRIATKVAPPSLDGTEEAFDGPYLERRFAGSLERLGVDAVELLYTHAPDDRTPIEATLEGLEGIRESGCCRVLGACNLDADELTAALDAAERLGVAGYQVLQNGFSLLQPDDDRAVRAICAERGLAYVAYSPMAGGALTGKYRRDTPPPPGSRLALRPDGVDEALTPEAHDAIDRLRARAQEQYGVPCGALSLAWLLHHPGVTALVAGPSRQAPHLDLAARASSVVLTDADVAEIESWFTSARP